MNTYRDILEILTSKKKIPNRTLSTPESKVRGSPIIGTQAKSKDQRPYFWKYFWLLFNWSGDIGNHLRSWNMVIFFPKYQFVIEPKIFPMLAKIKRRYVSNEFDRYIVVRTTSDEKGRMVAAKKLIIRSWK